MIAPATPAAADAAEVERLSEVANVIRATILRTVHGAGVGHVAHQVTDLLGR